MELAVSLGGTGTLQTDTAGRGTDCGYQVGSLCVQLQVSEHCTKNDTTHTAKRHWTLLEAPHPSLTGMSLTLFGSPPLIQFLRRYLRVLSSCSVGG